MERPLGARTRSASSAHQASLCSQRTTPTPVHASSRCRWMLMETLHCRYRARAAVDDGGTFRDKGGSSSSMTKGNENICKGRKTTTREQKVYRTTGAGRVNKGLVYRREQCISGEMMRW